MVRWFVCRVFVDYAAAIPVLAWLAGFGDHSNRGLGGLALYWVAFMAFLAFLDLRGGKLREGEAV